jgi:hypothetical protein
MPLLTYALRNGDCHGIPEKERRVLVEFISDAVAGLRSLLHPSPVLPHHQLVGVSEEDFGWQVSPQFAAERALDVDGLEGELPDAGRHLAAAPLAGDHEGLAG